MTMMLRGSFIGAKRVGDYGLLPGYRTGFRTAIMGCVVFGFERPVNATSC